MDRKSKIAIIGAGIGGLTAAISLHQKGFTNIEVFERRAKTQSIGAGFVMWANASRVLNKLGLLDEVSKLGGRLKQMQRFTNEGDYLGGIDIAQIDEAIGYPSYALSKTAFQNFLQSKINELGIPLRNNQPVISIEDNGTEQGFLRLQDDSVIKANIIIAADGRMNSIGRKYVHATNEPVFQNYINWVGIIESSIRLPIENNVLDYWGCGERFGIVPISKNKVYWAGCKALPINGVTTESTDKKELLNLFKDWPSPIKIIIENTPGKNIKRIPVFDHNPNPFWFKNNVCLLGDAAHASLPTSGQGACQAIEDAWCIAEAMDEFQNLDEAFNNYRGIRFEKTTAITIAGRDFSKSLFSTDEVYCLQRNTMAKLTDHKKTTEGMIELWSKNLH